MITRWNNGRCVGCDRSQSEFHRDGCQEVAAENRRRAQDNLEPLARPRPLAGLTPTMMIVDDPHAPDDSAEARAAVNSWFGSMDKSGVDIATGPDLSAIWGVRINADGTRTYLTEAEVVAVQQDREQQIADGLRYLGLVEDKPLPTKTAKDRQLLALLGERPMMVSDGAASRSGTPIDRQLADELTVTKAALALRDQQIGTLCRQIDELVVCRQAMAAEIAALKVVAVSRETQTAPTKSEVMGRAIGATLSGWEPVV